MASGSGLGAESLVVHSLSRSTNFCAASSVSLLSTWPSGTRYCSAQSISPLLQPGARIRSVWKNQRRGLGAETAAARRHHCPGRWRPQSRGCCAAPPPHASSPAGQPPAHEHCDLVAPIKQRAEETPSSSLSKVTGPFICSTNATAGGALSRAHLLKTRRVTRSAQICSDSECFYLF